MNQTKGATEDSINALPTHKFKLMKNENKETTKDNNESLVDEGGILAAGTDKERAISGEDAVRNHAFIVFYPFLFPSLFKLTGNYVSILT